MTDPNKILFDPSSLSDEYGTKKSLARYRELKGVFPNSLIFFRNEGCYYGFDETAVVLNLWFGYPFYKSAGMLIAKIEKIEPVVCVCQQRGIRYIVDEYGKLTFGAGKRFRLPKPLSYYEEHHKSMPVPKQRSTTWTESDSKHGGGWYDDVWTPGLPSSHFYKKRS